MPGHGETRAKEAAVKRSRRTRDASMLPCSPTDAPVRCCQVDQAPATFIFSLCKGGVVFRSEHLLLAPSAAPQPEAAYHVRKGLTGGVDVEKNRRARQRQRHCRQARKLAAWQQADTRVRFSCQKRAGRRHHCVPRHVDGKPGNVNGQAAR